MSNCESSEESRESSELGEMLHFEVVLEQLALIDSDVGL